jgi:hypothetical protein
MAQNGDRAGDQQVAYKFVTALAGAPEPFLAAAGVLPRGHPQPGGELAAGSMPGAGAVHPIKTYETKGSQ